MLVEVQHQFCHSNVPIHQSFNVDSQTCHVSQVGLIEILNQLVLELAIVRVREQGKRPYPLEGEGVHRHCAAEQSVAFLVPVDIIVIGSEEAFLDILQSWNFKTLLIPKGLLVENVGILAKVFVAAFEPLVEVALGQDLGVV